MKIGKILLLVLAAFIIALSVKALMDVPDRKAQLEGAVVVENGKILPENEGKLVIVRGAVDMLAPVYDDQLNITINSPKATRQRQVYEETGKNDDRYEWEWVSKENTTMLGEAKIGAFRLDDSVLNAFPVDVDYHDFDSAQVRGYNVVETGLGASRTVILPYGGYYYDDRIIDIDTAADTVSFEAMYAREGTIAYSYKAFDYDKPREMTVVAVQKGDALVADDNLGAIVKTEAVGKDDLISSDGTAITIASVIGLIAGAALIYFGLRRPKAPKKA